MQDRVTHLTVGYPKNDLMAILQRSSEYFGYKYVELPQGWSGRLQVLDKFRIVNGYINSGAVSKDQVILFTDAYDTLVTGSAVDLNHRLRTSDADIIFNGEIVFFPEHVPRPTSRAFFDKSQDRCKYLNSGCYIGYAWAVEVMTQWCIRNTERFSSTDDQLLAQEFLIHAANEGIRVKNTLDSKAAIFATLVGSAEFYGYFAGVVLNLHTGSQIGIIHANGFKDNIKIIRAIDLLCLDNIALDLRVLRSNDGRICARALGEEQLKLEHGYDPDTVFFLVKGNRDVVAISSALRILTFRPDYIVLDDSEMINAWERLRYHELTSDAGHGISQYFATDSSALSLSPIPLELMKVVDMPLLVKYARAIYRLF